MKLLVYSDLHLEFKRPLLPPDDIVYDVVVLAGDIHSPGYKAVRWAATAFEGTPVVYVPGNHEFYGCEINDELERMRMEAEGTCVRVMDRDDFVHGAVRFLGCTLWTDFALPILQVDGTRRSDCEKAMAVANAELVDFELVDIRKTVSGGHADLLKRQRFFAGDSIRLHEADLTWLRHRTVEPFHGKTVVLTHHAPSLGSIRHEHAADWLSGAFASELPADMFELVDLWVHGHVHSTFGLLARKPVSGRVESSRLPCPPTA